GRQRHGDVLLFTAGVGETEINELDLVVLHHLHHVCDGLGHQKLLCLWKGWDRTWRADGMQKPCHGDTGSPRAVRAARIMALAMHLEGSTTCRRGRAPHWCVDHCTVSGPSCAPCSCRPANSS